MRVQGWDPVLIICQIISLQSIHYLTLSLLLPPLISLTDPSTLSYSGGVSTVPHILDWREMASRSTASASWGFKEGMGGAWAGGKWVGSVVDDHTSTFSGGVIAAGEGDGEGGGGEMWDYGVDELRGWFISLAWLLASAIDIIPLYYLIRRPTHILDFALTLVFNHLILTTYFSKSFPTSLFFWVVQALGALLMIVVAEQLCVKREMQSDLDIGWQPNLEGGSEVIELDDR